MKLLISLLLLIITIYASEEKYAIKAQILEKIFMNVSIDKNLIIYSDNDNLLLELKKSNHFKTASNCQSATLIVLEDKNNLEKDCTDKPIFVLEYKLLKEIPQSFGAIFWKKGRPNIIIISPRAEKLSIGISEKLSEYTEDKVW